MTTFCLFNDSMLCAIYRSSWSSGAYLCPDDLDREPVCVNFMTPFSFLSSWNMIPFFECLVPQCSNQCLIFCCFVKTVYVPSFRVVFVLCSKSHSPELASSSLLLYNSYRMVLSTRSICIHTTSLLYRESLNWSLAYQFDCG